MKTTQVTTEVFCTLQIEGLHHWPECPFEEVAYLKDLHRHLFFVKAYKIVNHDDRDVEFIMLKHEIQKYFQDTYYDWRTKTHRFGAMSCEMIGQKLLENFDLSRVEVSEDNENGAIVTRVHTCEVCGK